MLSRNKNDLLMIRDKKVGEINKYTYIFLFSFICTITNMSNAEAKVNERSHRIRKTRQFHIFSQYFIHTIAVHAHIEFESVNLFI